LIQKIINLIDVTEGPLIVKICAVHVLLTLS
ncbi:MAG: hypothetical protein ACI9N3_001963, partial [Colwellia sp.]